MQARLGGGCEQHTLTVAAHAVQPTTHTNTHKRLHTKTCTCNSRTHPLIHPPTHPPPHSRGVQEEAGSHSVKAGGILRPSIHLAKVAGRHAEQPWACSVQSTHTHPHTYTHTLAQHMQEQPACTRCCCP